MQPTPDIKVLLVDADGVLIVPPRPFSHVYAAEHNLELSRFETFFRGPFRNATVGQADLKDLITEHSDTWAWPGDPSGLLESWFAAENVIDQALLTVLRASRSRGTKVYMATEQEQYRADYLRRTMFPGEFDGFFFSFELGTSKRDPDYFKQVLQQLQREDPELTPREIFFFDDSSANVANARSVGLSAAVYTSPDLLDNIFLRQNCKK